MMKKLMALMLAATMVSAPMLANDYASAALNEEAMKAIEDEVMARLEEEAKTNKHIAAAMKTEAAKRKLIAQIIAGSAVVATGALVVAYLTGCWPFNETAPAAIPAPTPTPIVGGTPGVQDQNSPGRGTGEAVYAVNLRGSRAYAQALTVARAEAAVGRIAAAGRGRGSSAPYVSGHVTRARAQQEGIVLRSGV